jgi:predicted NUDIX family phosphoesterase/thymidylate kinase
MNVDEVIMEVSEAEKSKIIQELEKLAERVLALKKESVPRRPIVIEFCGSPKAGKSTCINSLELFLRRNGFRTRLLTERASVCPVNNKYDPYFNMWTVTSALAELVELLANHSKDYDVVIMDRGIFDGLCWFVFLRDKNHLDTESFKSLEGLLLMNKLKAVLDLVYIFTVSPEVSLKREYANLLTEKTGSIMKPDILNSFKDSILMAAETYKSEYQRIEIYDTSNKPQNHVNYEVTKNILEILRDNIEETVGYFPLKEIDQNLNESFTFEEANISDKKLTFQPRSLVEDNNDYLQPLPILLIKDTKNKKILIVKKNKANTSKSSPESGKVLLYLGGHIRKEDMYQSKSTDLLSIAKYALSREIKEEIGIDYHPPKDDVNPFCMWIRDNDRSKKHLAMCFVYEADLDTLKINLDKNEFMTHGNTKSGSLITIPELIKSKSDLESWSKLLLEKYFDTNKDHTQIKLAL